jgi:hypothetical protein
MIGAEQALHCTPTKIETLSYQITQALVNQGPALLAEVGRVHGSTEVDEASDKADPP